METDQNSIERRTREKARVDRTFRRIMNTGLATMCLSLPLGIAGFVDTTRSEMDDANLDGSYTEYVVEHRSPINNYAWGSLVLGNVICGSSVMYKIKKLKKMGIDRWE